jgi:hypothetical protein
MGGGTVSVRDRTEEALAKLDLQRDGLCVHFSYGVPRVHHLGALDSDPLSDSAERWEAARVRAGEQYATFLRVVDWNRVLLEAVGSYMAADDEADPTLFGSDATGAGRALRAAMETRDTMPDWFRARRLERQTSHEKTMREINDCTSSGSSTPPHAHTVEATP